MKLMLLQHWAEKYFTEACRPSEQALGRWCRDEKIPSRKVGGLWYVDEDAWLADDDSLVERVLKAG